MKIWKSPRTPLLLGVGLAFAAPSFAQTPAPPPPEWQGEGTIGAGVTTGNTSTTDANAGLKFKHNGHVWTESGEFQADYAKTDGSETKNRLAAAGQVDRNFSERFSSFVRGTWEDDRFSGFANRWFAGLGLGYKVIDSKQTSWTLQGGPGYRVDEVRTVPATATSLMEFSHTDHSFGASAGSRFKQQLNEKVALTNDTDVTYSETSTQIDNTTALTFELMGRLSGRIGYTVRHDTNPPPTFKNTDTESRFSLVYKIG